MGLGFLRTSDQLVAQNSTWKHTTLTRDRQPCPRDSKPQSQQASGLRPRDHWDRRCNLCRQKNVRLQL